MSISTNELKANKGLYIIAPSINCTTTKSKKMKLIYRAEIYEYTPGSIRYVKPEAINWRFQIQRWGKILKFAPRPIQAYVKPHKMNWRFELAANPKLIT